MDSNLRFPDAPSGRSAEARTFSNDREFAPLAWRDRDFGPPAPSSVDLCVRIGRFQGHKQRRKLKSVAPFARNRRFESISLQSGVCELSVPKPPSRLCRFRSGTDGSNPVLPEDRRAKIIETLRTNAKAAQEQVVRENGRQPFNGGKGCACTSGGAYRRGDLFEKRRRLMVELRARNLPESQTATRTSVTGLMVDGGRFLDNQKRCLVAADRAGFAGRKADSVRRGLLRGFGFANYLESNGCFGLAAESVTVCQGDTDELTRGGGTGGSKSLLTSSVAIEQAVKDAIARGPCGCQNDRAGRPPGRGGSPQIRNPTRPSTTSGLRSLWVRQRELARGQGQVSTPKRPFASLTRSPRRRA
jgi:hypothetical protein